MTGRLRILAYWLLLAVIVGLLGAGLWILLARRVAPPAAMVGMYHLDQARFEHDYLEALLAKQLKPTGLASEPEGGWGGTESERLKALLESYARQAEAVASSTHIDLLLRASGEFEMRFSGALRHVPWVKGEWSRHANLILLRVDALREILHESEEKAGWERVSAGEIRITLDIKGGQVVWHTRGLLALGGFECHLVRAEDGEFRWHAEPLVGDK